ncbi:MAG: tRNA lysidine(34) synthetase TilS [Bacteroidota bacterium]
MLDRFNEYIDKQGLCGFGERVLLAVSGGVDSVVMAHLFAEAGYDCAIAHCNFQLRGVESDTDEIFVRELAARLEMPVYVKHCDVEQEMEEKGGSVQMAARELRYDWFEELEKEHAFDSVATAHNLNDSVETCFLNLARGTGIRGLTGIPPRNGRVIRPVLFASRREIERFASENRLNFREDLSNLETKYQRNKIRHDVIPSLEQINPGFIDTMAGNMLRMEEVGQVMEQAVERVRNEIFETDREKTDIDIARLKALVPLNTWLYELFSPFGFTRSQCEGIGQILDADPGRRSISPTHQLFKDRERLILVESSSASFERHYLDSPEKPSSLPFSMDVEVVKRDELKKIPSDADIACLDFDEISFPLTIRHWLHGDYFYPLGMDQIKKLSDFFVDEKVPVPEKDSTWILASGKKIVWIMGRRIDHRFRITRQTKRVLLLRLQPDVAP